MRAVIVLAVVLAMAGCGPRGSWLPTRAFPDMGGPTGFLDGTLVDVNGCVYLRTLSEPPTRYLVVWPFGYSRVDNFIIDGSKAVAELGSYAWLGGGEAVPGDYGVPNACRVANVWNAHGVLREAPF